MSDTFGPDDLMPWQEMTKRVKELEAKVESLTRTLDMWQEIMGIEVVVSVTGEAGDV